MEFEGKYRVKRVMTYDENGEGFLTREDIEKMEDNEDNADYINMIRMIIEISEENLLLKAVVTPEQAKMIKEEDPDIPFDEEGNVVLEAHEVVCKDGKWMFEAGEEDGETNYWPFTRNDEGDLMYGETMVLEKI